MGKPLRKSDESSPKTDAPEVQEVLSEAIDAVDGVSPSESPARLLQEQLNQQFAPKVSKLSARFITWLVIATCAGTWVAGAGLYSTL